MNQIISESRNAYRWAFIRMCLRHDWSIEDLHLILGYMKSVIDERRRLQLTISLEETSLVRWALNDARVELDTMMAARCLSEQERDIIRKLVDWPLT